MRIWPWVLGFLVAAFLLVLMFVPWFMSAWEQYRIDCPVGTTKVECQ